VTSSLASLRSTGPLRRAQVVQPEALAFRCADDPRTRCTCRKRASARRLPQRQAAWHASSDCAHSCGSSAYSAEERRTSQPNAQALNKRHVSLASMRPNGSLDRVWKRYGRLSRWRLRTVVRTCTFLGTTNGRRALARACEAATAAQSQGDKQVQFANDYSVVFIVCGVDTSSGKMEGHPAAAVDSFGQRDSEAL
jgi:hypothetical protein